MDNAAVLLDLFASGAPTAGSGSAAAFTGALAGSLLQGVARRAIRAAGSSSQPGLDALLNEARHRSLLLRAAMEEDSAAFERYWTERRELREARQRGAGEAEIAELEERASAALRQATDLPLVIARSCEALARVGLELFDQGPQGVRGEAAAAVLCAIAAGEAAAYTAGLNVRSAGAVDWAESRRGESAALHQRLRDLRRGIDARIDAKEERS
jgi:formiminotetrahydrofolate cyclodeaminase